MAKLGFQFTGDEADLNNNSFDRQPLPDGTYQALIADADYKATKSGNGFYVSVEFHIVQDGEYSGRKVWSNYNLVNPNPQAEEIGQQQFAKLCMAALGKPSCDDTDELLSALVVLGIGLEKNDPTRNRVKWADSVDGVAQEAAPAPVAKPAPKAAPAPAANKPWAKK